MEEHREANRRAGDRQAGFNDLLIDSVDETFTKVLGAKATTILYNHWSTRLGMIREEIPCNLPKFFESMDEIFGTGYKTIGEQVIRKLYAKAEIPLEYSENRPPLEYAKELKHILTKKPP